ncbi:MAG: hypothetical protein KH301_05820, partial [Brachyspira sp.]|nr:hypothetical protein [Brachyspira sp.]
HDIGMHLPSMQTLAVIAGAKYGRTDIGTYTLIMRNDYHSDTYQSTGNCLDFFKTNGSYRLSTSDVICVDTLPNGVNSSIASLAGHFWSSAEVSASTAQTRDIYFALSTWYSHGREGNAVPLCVGD